MGGVWEADWNASSAMSSRRVQHGVTPLVHLIFQVAPILNVRPGASVTSGVRPTSIRASAEFSSVTSHASVWRTQPEPQIQLLRLGKLEHVPVIVELCRDATPGKGCLHPAGKPCVPAHRDGILREPAAAICPRARARAIRGTANRRRARRREASASRWDGCRSRARGPWRAPRRRCGVRE